MNGVEVSAAAPARRTATWLIAGIGGLFGLFYAYAVWNAVGNLMQIASLPTGLNVLGWFVWIFAAIFPIIVWSVAFAVGYRRAVFELALTLLVGLAVVAVFWLNVVGYVSGNTASLLG